MNIKTEWLDFLDVLSKGDSLIFKKYLDALLDYANGNDSALSELSEKEKNVLLVIGEPMRTNAKKSAGALKRWQNKKEKAEKPKPKAKKEKFVKPTLQEVQDFIKTQNITNVDAEVFCNYYESNGWRIGRNAMKNWQMAVRGWATRNAKTGQQQSHALKGNKNNYTL